jgi:chemotaxis protein histidine kinase CheA
VHVAGEGLAVDRQVLDLMSEPLLHLVRNAVDHGLESAEERERAGKPPAGTVGMSAEQVGRVVHLTIEDDGRGVDLEAVRRAAVERGAWSPEAAADAGREALLDVLFSPGFSTRGEVSSISGRGFGLDIVRRRVESIGGSVSLVTEAGRGSTFVVTVPVSMVADPVLPVEVDGTVCALATNEVVTMREADGVPAGRAGEAEVVQLDDEPLPLRDLGELLGGRARSDRDAVVVVRSAAGSVALAVDRLLPVSGAVRQALDPFIEELDVVRGSVTVDGRLVTLLDARELIRLAEERAATPKTRPEAAARRARLLVVDDSELTRDVLVSTLEGFGCSVVEAVDGVRALELLRTEAIDLVVTDLDMPVMDGFELLGRIRASEGSERLPVIVMTTRAAPEDLRRASELGADAYLTKTRFRTEELAELVRRHTRGSR